MTNTKPKHYVTGSRPYSIQDQGSLSRRPVEKIRGGAPPQELTRQEELLTTPPAW